MLKTTSALAAKPGYALFRALSGAKLNQAMIIIKTTPNSSYYLLALRL
ncbi:hypothetical protein GA0116948_11031 [Chitinophaga costaii]|uniref:Uncharacterized protein n=1 Tax=Chitinophaga costaii TaxID=1335309 RepID=A0A1C4EVA1_9BACT|nr:hypothetical protein GA0116948_11031 [Chitinophaga costaii]